MVDQERFGSTHGAHDDEACPRCSSRRVLSDFLSDPTFRCCRDCGSTWRAPGEESA